MKKQDQPGVIAQLVALGYSEKAAHWRYPVTSHWVSPGGIHAFASTVYFGEVAFFAFPVYADAPEEFKAVALYVHAGDVVKAAVRVREKEMAPSEPATDDEPPTDAATKDQQLTQDIHNLVAQHTLSSEVAHAMTRFNNMERAGGDPTQGHDPHDFLTYSQETMKNRTEVELKVKHDMRVLERLTPVGGFNSPGYPKENHKVEFGAPTDYERQGALRRQIRRELNGFVSKPKGKP